MEKVPLVLIERVVDVLKSCVGGSVLKILDNLLFDLSLRLGVDILVRLVLVLEGQTGGDDRGVISVSTSPSAC